MSAPQSVLQNFPRGTTLRFATTFYDFDGVETQPPGAVVHIEDVNGEEFTLTMTAPSGAQTQWTASFDTRNITPGVVTWSIHSLDGTPFSVEDGSFRLTANAANLVTF